MRLSEPGFPPALHLSDVVRQRGSGSDAFILNVRHFSIARGQAIAVTGPSGCGKSTLLDLIGLVLKPDRAGVFSFAPKGGTALDLGRAWQEYQEKQLSAIRAHHLGYILQTGGVLPFLTVHDNIRLSRRLLGLSGDTLVNHLVNVLDIKRVLKKKPKALSIGERQRVCIARALAHEPSMILADEPTASLDPTNADNVMGLLLGLVEEMGVSAIIVNHDRHIVERYGLSEARVTPRPGAGVQGTESVLEMAS